MTILYNQIEHVKEFNLEYIGVTTVWDIHSGLSTSKQSNAYKFASEYFTKNKGCNRIIGLGGMRGRSQHSASSINMFVASTSSAGYLELNGISNAPCGWIVEFKREKEA